jgi:hypothetical protein
MAKKIHSKSHDRLEMMHDEDGLAEKKGFSSLLTIAKI